MASSANQPSAATAPMLLSAEPEGRGKSPQEKRKESKSPLTNDLLIAARKGHSKDVERLLDLEGGVAAVKALDKVGVHHRDCCYSVYDINLITYTEPEVTNPRNAPGKTLLLSLFERKTY